jgi:hypothetical protein
MHQQTRHPSQVTKAIAVLEEAGCCVTRCEFPPDPLPGLFDVDGTELTESQLIGMAADYTHPNLDEEA